MDHFLGRRCERGVFTTPKELAVVAKEAEAQARPDRWVPFRGFMKKAGEEARGAAGAASGATGAGNARDGEGRRTALDEMAAAGFVQPTTDDCRRPSWFQQAGWRIFTALRKHAKGVYGYSSLDVNSWAGSGRYRKEPQNFERRDSQEWSNRLTEFSPFEFFMLPYSFLACSVYVSRSRILLVGAED